MRKNSVVNDEEDSVLKAYLGQLARPECLPLDAATERRLVRRYRRGDKAAGQRVVTACLRLVVKIAIGYRSRGIPVADLIEQGNLGLLEALPRFELERGLRFLSYAGYWIRALILHYILKNRHLVAIGQGPIESKLFYRLARERARLTAALGEGEDINEQLAAHFGTTAERLREVSAHLDEGETSLDAKRFADSAVSQLDRLIDRSASPEENCALAQGRELVRRRVDGLMKDLSRRERVILEFRLYPKMVGEALTLKQVGRKLGLSRERVRQLEEPLKQKLALALGDFRSSEESDIDGGTEEKEGRRHSTTAA